MKAKRTTSSPQDILIVDDTPADLKLLTRKLQEKGYKVRPEPSGHLALQAAQNIPPDLILLDINLPEIDGFEVCKELKADKTLCDIPVIFISSYDEILDKVKAFSVGGVDYVTKPFQFEEVHARIKTHLMIRSLQLELKQYNQNLEELVRERTEQLAEVNERLSILDKAKNEFLHLISHELRTPLTGIFGILDMLFPEDLTKLESKELWNTYNKAKNNILMIIDDALLLTQIDISSDVFRQQSNTIQQILISALNTVRKLAESREVNLPECPPGEDKVLGETSLLTKAFTAILETAIKLSARHERIRLSLIITQSQVEVSIYVIGRTIPEEYLPGFFDFSSVTRAMILSGDLGLSPAVAQRIISVCKGSISVKNEGPAGVLFVIRLSATEPGVIDK
jgi:DNA-binding response OmpR family regulator